MARLHEGRIGQVNLRPDIIENVHDLVNCHRKKIGLPKWDFSRLPSQQKWNRNPPAWRWVRVRLLRLLGRKAYKEIMGVRFRRKLRQQLRSVGSGGRAETRTQVCGFGDRLSSR